MTEEGLDVTDVGTAFKKMGGKGVAEAVNGGAFVNSGLFQCVFENVLR